MYASSPEQRRAAKARELATTLYADHYDRLHAAARRHCDGWADPEEALQEALAIFVASFDPEAGSPPLPWLLLTLKRLCWAAGDRRRFEARLGVTGAGSGELEAAINTRAAVGGVDPLAAAIQSERARETREAMARLQPEHRRAISLLAIGYSYGEIGELTGLTPKQVDDRLQRTRAALRAQA